MLWKNADVTASLLSAARRAVLAVPGLGLLMFKDNSFWTRVTATTIALGILVDAFRIFSSLNVYNGIQEIVRRDWQSEADLTAFAEGIDNLETVATWVDLGTTVVFFIIFLIWVYRATRNAKYLSAAKQKIGPKWAVGWYFVPFANFWMPAATMNEIWWRSSWPVRKARPFSVRLWWLLTVVAALADRLGARAGSASDDLALLKASALITAVGSGLAILGKLLSYRVVTRINQMQVAKHAAHPGQPYDAAVFGDEDVKTPTAIPV